MPDLRIAFYGHAHPEPADVLLVVEVMDSTVHRDRRVKLPLYGRASLAEVWLVEVANERVEVHRRSATSPDVVREVRRRGDRLTIGAFPEVPFEVDEILG